MKYQNPIIRGFNPDPSICRVGEDYYLVTSSFEYFPGIPVYHSRDLVNWKQIGNCIDRPEQLPLSDAKSSGGIWAPTIRYEEGKFYLTAIFDGKGNFLLISDRPDTGWSNPIWTDFSGIDPSIMFENGTMYYCANDIGERYHQYGCEGISVAEMDRCTGKVIGEIKRVWNGTGGRWLEAPHIYHIGEYYYILAAEGGTGANHMIVAGRSKSIWGPYENCPENPILTNKNDTSKKIACSGHGDLVDDRNGNWWMVHLGTRPVQGLSHLGRETFLMPVTWENDWPVVGTDKKCHLEVEASLWEEQQKQFGFVSDFHSDTMELQWLFRRIPQLENYRKEDGSLYLTSSTVKLSDPTGSPTFMAVRQSDLAFEAEMEFVFPACHDGDMAGMVVYLSEQFFYRIFKKHEDGRDYIMVERQSGDLDVVVYQKQIEAQRMKLTITSDGEYYYFYYSINQEERIAAARASVRFLSCELAGKCFTGALVGVFTECDKEGTKMQVEYFKIRA